MSQLVGRPGGERVHCDCHNARVVRGAWSRHRRGRAARRLHGLGDVAMRNRGGSPPRSAAPPEAGT